MTLLERLAAVDIQNLAIRVQQIPAPTFAETDRAVFAGSVFEEAALDTEVVTHSDDVVNAYARVPGRDPEAPVLVISAHTDTVFPATTELTVRRDRAHRRIHGPGIGDNSLGVAALLALATAYGAAAREARDGEAELVRPACDIWLVANAGEEGLGDLRGIRTALDHVRSRTPRGVGAAIVLEGLALGGVYHRGIGVKRFRLEVRTPGGHSWADFGSPSAVHELLLRLARIVKLKIPSAPRSSINVGTIEGGTSINSIASHARAEIDLRSESAAGVEELVRRVADATGCSSEEDGGRGGLRGIGAALGRAFGAAREGGVQARLVPIGDRPAAEIPADHPLVDAAVRALAAVGLRAELRTGSTDANALLAGGVPTVCVGISTGAHAHRVDEYVNVDPIERGLKQLGHLIPEAAAVAARHQDEGRTR